MPGMGRDQGQDPAIDLWELSGLDVGINRFCKLPGIRGIPAASQGGWSDISQVFHNFLSIVAQQVRDPFDSKPALNPTLLGLSLAISKIHPARVKLIHL